MPRKVVYKEMSWAEIQARVQECDICIIPLGAMEQHGYHLPVGTDTYQCFELARRGAERAADEVGAVVLPGLDYGSTASTRFFPCTVHGLPPTLTSDALALMGG